MLFFSRVGSYLHLVIFTYVSHSSIDHVSHVEIVHTYEMSPNNTQSTSDSERYLQKVLDDPHIFKLTLRMGVNANDIKNYLSLEVSKSRVFNRNNRFQQTVNLIETHTVNPKQERWALTPNNRGRGHVKISQHRGLTA